MVIIDCSIAGKRQSQLAMVVGDQVVVIENNGKPAQQWLRDAVISKLSTAETVKKSGGVEQA